MSHTFALWAWPLDLKGPHLTVIPLFTCVHGLQASNSQEREDQALAPRRRQGQQAQLGDHWKNYILGLFRPKGREPQKPGLLFDRSSNLPEPGRRQCGQRTPPTENSEAHTVDWTRPQTGAAIGKANAMFSETSPTFPLAAVGLCQGPQQGHSWDLSEGPEGRDCHTRTPIRSPLVP